MTNAKWISGLFWVGAAYDGLLGLAFLLFSGAIYEYAGVTPPNHFGYVQFPAALLIVFALMFIAIARNPIENRKLIVYGVLLKASYCGVAFRYWFSVDIPKMWKPFAILDVLFGILFVWSYLALGKRSES